MGIFQHHSQLTDGAMAKYLQPEVTQGPLDGKGPKALMEMRAAIIDAAKKYHAENEAKWSESHEAVLAAMMDRAEECKKRADGKSILGPLPSGRSGPTGPYMTLKDSRGREVNAVAGNQRWGDLPGIGASESQYAMGDMVVAAVTGRRDHLSPEIGAVLSGSSAVGGGYLVPSHMSSEVIDLARAKSRLMQAGAVTIPVSGDNLKIGRVTSDPTMSVKIENDAFDETDISFGAILIVPRLIGCLVRASREFIEDAPNAAALIEETMAKSLAVSLDNLGLQGSGTGQNIKGLLNYADIDETDIAGALTWTNLATAAKAVRTGNHEPTAAIMHVDADHALKMTADTQNRWLGPPPTLENVSLYDTTNMPAANAVIGDFSKFAWGIRQEANIEISNQGSDAFEKHQVLFKIWFRGDTAVLDASAFHRIAGIA